MFRNHIRTHSVIFFCMLLTSCASAPIPNLTLSEIEIPKVGEKDIKELGDTLIQFAISRSSPSWMIMNKYGSLSAGDILTPFGDHPKYESYLEESLCRDRETGEWTVGQNESYNCNDFTAAFSRRLGLLSNIEFQPATFLDYRFASINKELIYNGRIENQIKFIYREFSNEGFSRPAFSQEIQYDLNESNVIGFKGARIRILKATNREIEYEVLAHFDR